MTERARWPPSGLVSIGHRQMPVAQRGGVHSMPRTLTALAAFALVVGACGGGSAAATSAPTVAAGEPAATGAATAGTTAEATQAPAATGSGGGRRSSQNADAPEELAQQLT